MSSFPKIIITRAEPQASAFAAALLRAGPELECLIAPLRARRARPDAKPDAKWLDRFDLLIFTSAAAFDYCDCNLSNRMAICVGKETASALCALGAKLIGEFETAAALLSWLADHVAKLARETTHSAEFRALALLGHPTSPEFERRVNKLPFLERRILYQMEDLTWSDQIRGQISAAERAIFPIFSQASFPPLANALKELPNRQERCLLPLSQNIKTSIERTLMSGPGFLLLDPPERPDREAMIDAIINASEAISSRK